MLRKSEYRNPWPRPGLQGLDSVATTSGLSQWEQSDPAESRQGRLKSLAQTEHAKSRIFKWALSFWTSAAEYNNYVAPGRAETISKSKCPKFKTNAANQYSYKMFWDFEFMSLEFVCNFVPPWAGFEFRISLSLISWLDMTILMTFHFANLGFRIYETGHSWQNLVLFGRLQVW